MIVSPASRIDRAISFGVFCRSAPSTSAIIRSRNVSPGLAVIRTTISSLSTRVPPVTAERSPPDSRIDRRRLAGDRRLVDGGDALDDVAVAGDHLAGRDDAQVAELQRRRRLLGDRAVGQADSGRRVGAGLAQRVGLRLAAPFGHRLGEVGEQHGEPQPRRRRDRRTRSLGRCCCAKSRMNKERGQHRADLDDEHHRVAHHRARVELPERVERCRLDDRRIEDRLGR